MNNKVKASPVAQSFAHEDVRSTLIQFRDSETVSFHQNSDGMEALIKVRTLPQYEGPTFNQDYLDFLRENGINNFIIDFMLDSAEEGLRKGLAFNAVMGTMK